MCDLKLRLFSVCQVTELVHDILKDQYVFRARSLTLKAWRDIKTYFLTAKKHSVETSPTHQYNTSGVFNPRGEPSSAALLASSSRMSVPNSSGSMTERTPLVQPIVAPLVNSVQQTTPTLQPRLSGVMPQEPLVQLKVNVTPPGSMGQRRRNLGSAGSGEGNSKQDQSARKQSGGTLQQLQNQYLVSVAQFEAQTRERVESPDLPLIHYAKGGSGGAVGYQRQVSTGRTPDGAALIATLTQSQLLGQSQYSPAGNAVQNRVQRGSRGSRGSSPGREGMDSDGQMKQMVEVGYNDNLLMIDESIVASRVPVNLAAPPLSSNGIGGLQQTKQHSASQSPFSGSPNVVPVSVGWHRGRHASQVKACEKRGSRCLRSSSRSFSPKRQRCR